jgi:hypothetical protein
MGNCLIPGKGLAGGQLQGRKGDGLSHWAVAVLFAEIDKSKMARRNTRKHAFMEELHGFIWLSPKDELTLINK